MPWLPHSFAAICSHALSLSLSLTHQSIQLHGLVGSSSIFILGRLSTNPEVNIVEEFLHQNNTVAECMETTMSCTYISDAQYIINNTLGW